MSTNGPRKYVDEEQSSFKKGLSLQRELFKSGKDGSGENNFDQMCDALENLKSDLKAKIMKAGRKTIVLKVEATIDWFRTLEHRYTRNTQEGVQVILPRDISIKVNKNLTRAYELLINEMDELGLL